MLDVVKILTACICKIGNKCKSDTNENVALHCGSSVTFFLRCFLGTRFGIYNKGVCLNVSVFGSKILSYRIIVLSSQFK